MSQTNKTRPAAPPVKTHEGGAAVRANALAQLRRTVMTSLLWENNFYESGVSAADRIKALIPQVTADEAMFLAIEARQEMFLRHVPLLLVRGMVRAHPSKVRETLQHIIKRPDELAEFLSIYWADNEGKKTLANSVKRGLADAMANFSQFQLAKWDRKDKPVRLRDVMFLTHAKPKGAAQKWTKTERKADKERGGRDWPFSESEEAFFLTAQDLLKQEGTWEDRMSAGEKPNVVFTELMEKGELGALAFIRNLRKMDESGVDRALIKTYSETVGLRGVLPHQLVMAARINKQFEEIIDAMMLRSLAGIEKLPGKTVVLVDVSGSMSSVLSKPGGKPRFNKPGAAPAEQTTFMDTAAAVAIMARELCEEVEVYTFSNNVVQVPARRGMALREAILTSQPHGGTYLEQAVLTLNTQSKGYDRIIVVTDEQSHDGSGMPLKGKTGYIMNVASYQYGVGHKDKWTTISGWSPQVLRYIKLHEADTADLLVL